MPEPADADDSDLGTRVGVFDERRVFEPGAAPKVFAYTALGDSVDEGVTPLVIVAVGVVVLTGAIGAIVAVRLRRAG